MAAPSAWVVVLSAIFPSRHWKVKIPLNVGDIFKVLSGFFSLYPLKVLWIENDVSRTTMTHQNNQTNGASLEDCHTNFFALVSHFYIDEELCSTFNNK